MIFKRHAATTSKRLMRGADFEACVAYVSGPDPDKNWGSGISRKITIKYDQFQMVVKIKNL